MALVRVGYLHPYSIGEISLRDRNCVAKAMELQRQLQHLKTFKSELKTKKQNGESKVHHLRTRLEEKRNQLEQVDTAISTQLAKKNELEAERSELQSKISIHRGKLNTRKEDQKRHEQDCAHKEWMATSKFSLNFIPREQDAIDYWWKLSKCDPGIPPPSDNYINAAHTLYEMILRHSTDSAELAFSICSPPMTCLQ